MIALSSFRPFGEHKEYDRNQVAAKWSWLPLFSTIFYFNQPEEQMDGENVRFIPFEPFPPIKAMAELASGFSELVAIINADIVLTPGLREVERYMLRQCYRTAMSRRYQFTPGNPLETAVLVDVGLDIFIADPDVWRRVARTVEPYFRIGHNRWDTFTLGFFNFLCPGKVLDFTPARVVFHPLHSGRRQPYAIPDKLPTPFMGYTGIPRPKIKRP